MTVSVQPTGKPAKQHVFSSDEAARRERDKEVVGGVKGDTVKVVAKGPAKRKAQGVGYKLVQPLCSKA